MPSLRPRWPQQARWPARTDERPAPSVIGSWVGGTLHLWGWDGAHTALPSALHRAFAEPRWAGTANPFLIGHLSSLDVARADGDDMRPASVRLPADRAARWLHARPNGATTDSLRWLAAVADVARATVAAGLVAPRIRTDRDMPVARWVPVPDPAVQAVLADLAAAMPPICVPTPQDPTTVVDIHAAMVDSLARHRLAEREWKAPLPSSRDPEMMAARSVMRALGGLDPLIGGSGLAHPDELAALAARFERHERRLRGEPVVLPRVRLVVPDDPYDDWDIRLELVDEADPGRWCSAEDVWDASPVAVEVAGGADHLARLEAEVGALAATVAACIDVAADLAHEHEPVGLELAVEDAERFLEQAPAELAARGIELVGPERLVRAGVRVAGRATPRESGDHASRFGREAVVAWKLVVADDDGPAAISDAELERAERAGATLLHSGRRWVRIDPAAMRRARKLLEEQVREHSVVDAVTLLKLAGEGTLDVGAEAGPDAAAPAAWTDELLAGLPDERLQEEHEPDGFAGELRPYQRRGLAWLRFLARLGLGGCLADDMGLGKTATTLAYLLDRPGPHLVICPLSVVHNWQAEANRFAPALRVVVHHGAERGEEELADADLVITTYGLLPRDLVHLGAVEWSTVVADEAQLIKNPATHAAKALRALRAGQKVALTGTPVENRLADLWAILDVVNPGMLGSRERFRHRFAKPIERDGNGDAAARLRRITQPFVLRRTKADRSLVPDLPDKIEQVAWAGLTREQAVLYQHVVDQLLADAAASTGMKRRGLVLAALDAAQADLQPPRPRARRRLPPRRALRQARPLRRARRRAARPRRAGARVHAVPGDGRVARAPPRRAADDARPVPPRRRGEDPARHDGGRVPGRPRRPAAARVPEGGWHRAQPHRGEPGDPLRPVVEPGRRGPGHRPGVAHRPGPHRERAQAGVRGHGRGAHRGPDRSEARPRRRRRRQRRVVAVRAVDGRAARPRGPGRRRMSAPRRTVGTNPAGRLPAAMLRALAAELSDPGRFSRAKSYARDGAVVDIEIEPGQVRGAGAGLALRALRGHDPRRAGPRRRGAARPHPRARRAVLRVQLPRCRDVRDVQARPGRAPRAGRRGVDRDRAAGTVAVGRWRRAPRERRRAADDGGRTSRRSTPSPMRWPPGRRSRTCPTSRHGSRSPWPRRPAPVTPTSPPPWRARSPCSAAADPPRRRAAAIDGVEQPGGFSGAPRCGTGPATPTVRLRNSDLIGHNYTLTSRPPGPHPASEGPVKTSRRTALKAALAVVAGAPLLLAGCSAGSSSAGADGQAVLKWANSFPTNWDPVTSGTGADVFKLSLPYAALTELDAAGAATPGLAESWAYNDDGTEVTFTLRPDLTFSDGTALDAEAVKFHFDRTQDPGELGAPRRWSRPSRR